MTKYIEAWIGHVKRAGARRAMVALGVAVDGASVSGDGYAAVKFGEAAPEFRLRNGFHAGVVLRIAAKKGRRSADSLEEHSVTLTQEQAQLLVARIEETIATNRRLAKG